MKEQTVQILKKKLLEITEILEKSDAYACLIMDEDAISILSEAFTPTELTQMRFILKESLNSERNRQPRMLAVYVFSPSEENIERIAQDFGYSKQQNKLVESMTSVQKKRTEEKCCIPTDRFYNPYSYRGLFLLPLSPIENTMLEQTGLVNILGTPKFTPLNVDYIVRSRNMIDFSCKDAFSALYLKTRTQAYITAYVFKTVDKLIHLFTNLGIRNV